MFSKFKSRKAPLSLSSVSNAIKTAGNADLSPSDVTSKRLELALIAQLGLPPNSILAVAFDPVQSLLALSTTTNEVRVYGQQNVEVVFEFDSSLPITHLAFVKGVYLACISTTAGSVTILSMHSKQILKTYSTSASISSVCADPAMDWLVLGLHNGSILFYDADRLNLTPFRIDNLQKLVLPKERMSPALRIEWHPRDIGTILVTYSHSAMTYSLAEGKISQAFVYQVPKGAKGFEMAQFVDNGGKNKLFGSSKAVTCQVKEAHFHPNGLHVVTLHADSTLVFWDAADGTLLEARNTFTTNLHLPGPSTSIESTFQISTVRWVCGKDPEETQLVIAGGDTYRSKKDAKEPSPEPTINGVLHVLDFGYTLKYSMTSHAKQGEFYSSPQNGQKTIPITYNESSEGSQQEFIEQILPLPTDGTPYFGGNHNPHYLLLVSNFGSVYFIKFSVGVATNNSNSSMPSVVQPSNSSSSNDLGDVLLPTSIGYIFPLISCSSLYSIKRIDWYSILSSRAATGSSSINKNIFKGGSPVGHIGDPKPIGNSDGSRDILITGHQNGLVRLLDVSRGEINDQESVVQISLKETLYNNGDPASIKILFVSCSFESREMMVGLGSGDVVICKFGKKKPSSRSPANPSSIDYRNCPVQHVNGDARIIDISDRISGTFSQSVTFIPRSMLQLTGGAPEEISCLKMSNIGFGAVAYKSGRLVVCDITRGPAIIFNLDAISHHLASVTGKCYITTMEFSIMEYGQEGFSSILLMVGTNCGGNLVLFKILPQSNGGFEVVFADKTSGLNYRALGSEDQTNSRLDDIIPINSKDGRSTVATLETFRKLGQGILIPGYIVTSSHRDIRVLKLPKTKLSHKVIEDTCLRTGIIELGNQVLLACVVKSGFIQLFSLPALNDVADIKISKDLMAKFKNSLGSESARKSTILPNGDFFVKTSPTEGVHLRAYFKDAQPKNSSKGKTTDLLFNPNAIIPPRPSAGALSWVIGQTKYIGLEDLTHLITGPNRKPAKHEESALAHNISPEANLQHNYGEYDDGLNERGYKDPKRKGAQAGYGAGFGAQGFMRSLQGGLDAAEETFHGYANTLSETVTENIDDQKKSFYSSALKSKMGF